jgi:hypothetical protein
MLLRIIPLLALVSAAWPQDKEPRINTKLKPLAFLVGKWEGGGEMPGMGKFADESSYEFVQNGNFLKHEYSMAAGKMKWTDTGFYGYDIELKKLVGFTFGGDGTIGRSTASETEAANSWTFGGKSAGHSPFKEWRTTISKVDEDTHTVKVVMLSGGKESAMPAMTYKRKK